MREIRTQTLLPVMGCDSGLSAGRRVTLDQSQSRRRRSALLLRVSRAGEHCSSVCLLRSLKGLLVAFIHFSSHAPTSSLVSDDFSHGFTPLGERASNHVDEGRGLKLATRRYNECGCIWCHYVLQRRTCKLVALWIAMLHHSADDHTVTLSCQTTYEESVHRPPTASKKRSVPCVIVRFSRCVPD